MVQEYIAATWIEMLEGGKERSWLWQTLETRPMSGVVIDEHRQQALPPHRRRPAAHGRRVIARAHSADCRGTFIARQ